MKKVKQCKFKQKRHIEDVPFYKFEYKFDDLPLDPARPFILEQIGNYSKVFRDSRFI
jgi:dynein heavy chain